MKIIIGKGKAKKRSAAPVERIVFTLGLVLMCCMLALPLIGRDTDSFEYDAVAVMGNVQSETKEEIKLPDNIGASSEERWSFYDYIGELFAGLIFGEW